MKAKTMKFLAVLAVMAMAFAAVAVFAPAQSDAAESESVWTIPTDATKASSITLGEDVIKATDGMTLVDATAYYVTEDMTLTIDKEADVSEGGILIFLKEDVTVTVIIPEEAPNVVAYALLGVVESTDKQGNTVLTLHANYGVDSILDSAKGIWATADKKINYPTTWDKASSGNGGIAHNPKDHGTDEVVVSYYEGKDLDGKKKMMWATQIGTIINVEGTAFRTCGTFDGVEFYGPTASDKVGNEATTEWTFLDATGPIGSVRAYDSTNNKFLASANTASLDNFKGIISMKRVEGSGTATAEAKVAEIPVIERWDSGNITVTKGSMFLGKDVYIPEGSSITFLEGTTISAAVMSGEETVKGVFAYKDEYNDIHSFMTDNALSVGMGDLTISAVDNMIVIDGTVTLTATTTYSFTGNATLSGMVYTKPTPTSTEAANLILKNTTKDRAGAAAPADIKIRTFQVTDGGAVTLNTSVLVETGCSFYVSGDMTIGSGAVLKIAEGAVVKPEGTLTVTPSTTASNVTTPGASIWNAGQFIATNYDKEGKYFDKQLIRVFMNTGYQTGTFYLGSSVYDGTITADADSTAQSPLKVAFGSYIDMTGIDKVNLTSGGIDVNNALYKYKTLILATYNNTIALTATFDNQYPVTVALDGKSASVPVMTAKSATISNVVWQSPISATLYVTAPEVYTVILAKEVSTTTPATSTTPWTEGFTIKDQNGRTIPIAADGTIKVVFGYQYTIEGANSTSNYKFFSPNGELTDLTKVDKTKGTFTMIRNNLNITSNVETPVVLQITEGLAVELTVYLDDDDKKYSEGDVFMYYNVANDAGKVVGDGTPVTVQFDDDNNKVGIITGIYSNDEIYFKSEFVKFFKSTAIAEGAKKIVFPIGTDDKGTTDTADDTEGPVDVVLSSEKFEQKFTFSGITKTDKAASFTLECTVDTVKVYFTFGNNTTDSQKITVDFEEYCAEAGHKETVTTKRSDTPQATDTSKDEVKWQFYIEMAVGEVYKVSWSEVNNYISKMTYSDKATAAVDTDKEYESGTAVTAKTDLYYTLTEEALVYIIVENQTDLDLTLSIGKFSADIASKKSNSKVIVNDKDNTLILSKKGYTIAGWDFTITAVTTDTSATESTVGPVYVSGPQTTQTAAWYGTHLGTNWAETSPASITVKKITITSVDADMTRYFVNVLKDDHGAIDPFDQNGYMGDERKAYVTTQFGYTVIDVLYEYQEVDMTEKAVGHATKGYTPEGVEVWTYTMPASNVLLKPVILKDTRMLSFVDQNGETIAETITVTPLTQVDMAVPCKPLYKIVEVTTEPTVEGFNYNPETGNMTFTMPDADVKVIVTCEEIQYSEKLLVTVGQEKNGADINVVLYALDGKAIGPGEVTIEVWYTYINEFGDVSVDYVDVTLTYEANDQTVAVLTDDTFIEELAENYNGAYAITGGYTFGTVEGELSTTEYKPVEA